MSGGRDIILKFIKRYGELPVLWMSKDPDYHSKEIRAIALDKLVHVLQKADKTATRDTVLKKINNIRTTFRKELYRVKASERSGGPVYVPKLWYFKDLLFLRDHDKDPPKHTKRVSIFDDLSEDEHGDDEVNHPVSAERDLLLKFIKQYNELPVLWRPKDPDYHCKEIKKIALDKLAHILQKADKTATRDTVLKKINNIRTTFRKELHKIRDSELSGATGDQVHVPKLWYFKDLLFLRDQDKEPPTESKHVSILDESSEDAHGDGDEKEQFRTESHVDEMFESEDSKPILSRCTSPQQTSQHSAMKPRLKTPPISINLRHTEPVLDPLAQFTDAPQILSTNPEDSHHVFGMYLAAKLKEMPQDVGILCRRLINEAIYLAESNQLTIRTSITN